MARSSVARLGGEYSALVEDLLREGATVTEITDAVNDALEAAGRDERVSRSAVGRTTQSLAPVLHLKAQMDDVVDALRREGPAGNGLDQQIELLRGLVIEAGVGMAGGGGEPREVRRLAAALLDLERAGTLADRRIEDAERRAREAAAEAGAEEARSRGVPDDIVAGMLDAMRGRDG